MTKTERIFEADVSCREFTASVLSCTPRKKGGYEVALDRTAFFPEGGGQPGDRGTLGGVTVTDTHERDGVILHYTDGPLEPGAAVTGALDWTFRFDNMQNHSGEHLLTGVIHKKTGCNNVGFHMGADTITVDLDVEITPEELAEYEVEANRVVWQDIPCRAWYPEPAELAALEYRSKKALEGAVRLVSFPGADLCACCGTHVTSSGQVGLIKLISVQKFRGGSRIEMLSGRRALAYIHAIEGQNHAISVALSAKPMETAQAVERLKEENARLTYRTVALETEAFARIAAACAGEGNVVRFEDGLTPDGVRKLAVAVMDQCEGVAAVFSGDDAQDYRYALGQTGGDLRALVKELNKALSGRGGGKPFFAQGSVAARREEIEAFLAARLG
ncbi:MAG: DHHA1 domain-containing protein [Clostridiales bacterium]|nr:DHHA1 domain-containing protein [Clostridiales bacterium]